MCRRHPLHGNEELLPRPLGIGTLRWEVHRLSEQVLGVLLFQLRYLLLDLPHLGMLIRVAHAQDFALHLERHDGAAKGSARLCPCLRGRVDASHDPILLLKLQQLLLGEVDLLRRAFELRFVENFLPARPAID